MLFELARSYHSALQKVDVSGFDTNQQGTVLRLYQPRSQDFSLKAAEKPWERGY